MAGKLETDRPAAWGARPGIGNVALAAVLLALAVPWVATDDLRPSDALDLSLYAALTLIVVVNVLRRPPPAAADRRWWVAGVCTLSLVSFLGFDPGESSGASVSWMAYTVMLGCHVVGGLACIYLGRSFAILPARRGIKTGFLYRFVRHPVYAFYILADSLFVLAVPSPRNILVLGISTGLLYWRAVLEERVLRQDAAYETYMRKTRWRFVPLVI